MDPLCLEASQGLKPMSRPLHIRAHSGIPETKSLFRTKYKHILPVADQQESQHRLQCGCGWSGLMVGEAALVSPDSCLSIGRTVENPTLKLLLDGSRKGSSTQCWLWVLGFSFVFYTARYQDQKKRGQGSKQEEGLGNT